MMDHPTNWSPYFRDDNFGQAYGLGGYQGHQGFQDQQYDNYSNIYNVKVKRKKWMKYELSLEYCGKRKRCYKVV